MTNFETQRIESAIIGIGLNIRPSKDIPKELEDIVGFIEPAAEQIAAANATGANTATCNTHDANTTMCGATGAAAPNNASAGVSRCRLAAEVAGQVIRIYDEPPEKVMAEYKRLVFLIGEDVEVHPIIGDEKSIYTATAVDIDDNAGLVVKLADGTIKTLSSGEVTLKSASFTK